MIVLTRRKEELLGRLVALAGGDAAIVVRALYDANRAHERPPLSDVIRRILTATRAKEAQT